jgi:glycosyltransferase involved in cell wall biosynthesis
MDKKITLLLPVWNEIGGLKKILPTIPKNVVNEIVAVDGGSTDGTVEFLLENKIRVIKQKRKGLALGILDALEEINTEYVITFSPDGNCRAEDLEPLVNKMKEGFDLVVVSRYLPPAKSYDDDIITGFGNFLFTFLIRMLGKSKMTDCLNIYRGYRISITRNGDFLHYLYGPVLEPLISAYVNLKKLSYAEIPGEEPKRIDGERKMRVIYNGSCILLMVCRLYLAKIGFKI